MPFRSRSQLGVCYNKAIKAGAQGKSSGWGCDKWLAETPNPSCLPYSEKYASKASARPKASPSGRCRTLTAKERVTGPVIEGARGGHYFMAAGVKVYIPKGHAELAYAKRTYGVAGAPKVKATKATEAKATKTIEAKATKATKTIKAKATKAKTTKAKATKTAKAKAQSFTDLFEAPAGPEVASQFKPGNGASLGGKRGKQGSVAKKKVWKIRFTPILFTDEMSQSSTGSTSLDKLVASRLAKDQTRIKDIPWDLNPVAVSYEPSKEGLGDVIVTVRPSKAMTASEVIVAVTEAIEIGPDTWMEGDITILSQAEAAKSPFFKSSKSPVEVTVAIDNVE